MARRLQLAGGNTALNMQTKSKKKSKDGIPEPRKRPEPAPVKNITVDIS
jgi:hypothetical protein